MRLSTRITLSLPAVLLAACAHNAQPRSNPTSTTSLSSSQLTRAWPIQPGSVGVPTLDQWAWRHPDAARGLGQWIVAHRETAHALARWQPRHAEQMEALVDWSTTHPYDSLSALFFDRTGWEEFQAIVGADDDADGFMTWIRSAPRAAREMAYYSNGLAFLDGEVETLLRSSYSEAALRENPFFRSAAPDRR